MDITNKHIDECFAAVERAQRYNPKLKYYFKVNSYERWARIKLQDPDAKEPFVIVKFDYEEDEDYRQVYVMAARRIDEVLGYMQKEQKIREGGKHGRTHNRTNEAV